MQTLLIRLFIFISSGWNFLACMIFFLDSIDRRSKSYSKHELVWSLQYHFWKVGKYQIDLSCGVGCMYVDTHAWWWYDKALNRSITSKEERHFVKSGQQRCVTNLICVKHIAWKELLTHRGNYFWNDKTNHIFGSQDGEIVLSFAQVWMIVCHDFWFDCKL